MKNVDTILLSFCLIWFASNYGVFFIWYLSNYKPTKLLYAINQLYCKLTHFLNFCNHMINPEYFTLEDDYADSEKPENSKEDLKNEQKYEDKYVEDIRKMNKEFIFDETEEKNKLLKYLEYIKEINDNYAVKIETLQNNLNEIEEQINKEKDDDEYYVYSDSNSDSTSNEYYNSNEIREKNIQILLEEKNKLVEELNILQKTETEEGQHEIQIKADKMSFEFIINQRLEKLKNCYVMEFTPLGNVLMIYEPSRNSFKYYSDNTIPYRYLESVARKYVKFYKCRPIFVDMEEELKIAEDKWEKEKKEKEEKEEEQKRKDEELKSQNKPIENKKNVFAKFKSYNKDTSNKSMVPPPKNSIPNKKLTQEQENEKMLLKEKANRYTYEGKIANFNFLKKIERKVIDKKYATTFADFKKMQTKNSNIF